MRNAYKLRANRVTRCTFDTRVCIATPADTSTSIIMLVKWANVGLGALTRTQECGVLCEGVCAARVVHLFHLGSTE
jgi:hypothetical protein